MALDGVQKAALLLMGLEPTTAAELLKAAEPEIATRIAAELAYLEASGTASRQAAEEPVREFIAQLREQAASGGDRQFLQRMLQGAYGPERSREVLERISALVDRRDPFLPVRAAEPEAIAEALRGESPQVAGLVLAELPPRSSMKLLPLLSEEVRIEAVRGMTREETVSPETRMRVATVVRERLVKTQASGGGQKLVREKQLRRVAMLLRGVPHDLRSALLDAVGETDEQTRTDVERLMVVWEDLTVVGDRSLQEALRSVDARNVAVALTDADDATVTKLRENMSERQSGMLDEEIALLSSPSEEDVQRARGELLKALRELAANNMLTFEED